MPDDRDRSRSIRSGLSTEPAARPKPNHSPDRSRARPLRLSCPAGCPTARLSCAWCVLQGLTTPGSGGIGCAASAPTLVSRPGPHRLPRGRFSVRVGPKRSPHELFPALQSARTETLRREPTRGRSVKAARKANVLRIVSGSALPRGPAPCSLSARPGGGGRALRAPLARFCAPSALESGGVDSLAETPTEVGVPRARKRAPGALSPGLRLPGPEGPTGSRRCLSRFVPPSPFLRPRRFAPPDGAEAPSVRATNRAAIHSCSGFPQQRSWGSRALQGVSRFSRTPPLPASSSPPGLVRAGPASAVAFACTVAPDLQGFALSVSRSWRGASRSSLRGAEPRLVSAASDRSPPLNRP